MREKDENKKKETEYDKNRRHKSEEMQVREKEYRLIGIESFKVLVRYVLTFGMDHINNLKVKDLRVIICYQFGLERLKGRPKKVNLVEAVTNVF